MDERTQKAFDFAKETTKQLLTLSTGIIALTITFSKTFAENVPPQATIFLKLAWLAYLLSILFGIWTLMALTGTLEPKDKSKDIVSIWGGNVTVPAGLQVLTFLAGLVLIVVFGIKAI